MIKLHFVIKETQPVCLVVYSNSKKIIIIVQFMIERLINNSINQDY